MSSPIRAKFASLTEAVQPNKSDFKGNAANEIEKLVLNAVMKTNEGQPIKMITLLEHHMDIPNKTIGILGLSFKPGSDDVRESRAVPVIKALLDEGAIIKAFDPVAMNNFRPLFPNLQYAKTAEEVLDSDAVFILTEWEDFENLDFHGKIVIDGRRIEKARIEAEKYEGVCW